MQASTNERTASADPDGYFSTMQYDYDLGAVRETTDPKGAKRRTAYDAAGRVSRVEVNNGPDPNDEYTNGANTRYVYDQTLTHVDSFTLLQTSVPLLVLYSFQQLDGIGRVTATASTFPNSTGGYRGQVMFYDTMGRVTSQSNPTEMSKTWGATGDDSAWIYTTQTYDWKGRPLVTTNPGSPQTTRQFDYTGCGCAGGEVVTSIDESNRKQRTTYDVLGRVSKTEVFNADANSSVYATTGYLYNGRDQATRVRQYQGPDTSTTYQDTVMTYDGHGRLQTRHRPIEIALDGLTLTYTTFDYNADDTLHVRTDPRGATATYTYNARHLVTQIKYVKPAGSGPDGPDAVTVIPPAPQVDFDYDEAGNRKWMTDGQGTEGEGRTDYTYDKWSRLRGETRQFTNVINNGGAASSLTYDYNLAGEMTSLTDAFGQKVDYAYDQAGELTSASLVGTDFVSAMRYRAWGALKQMDFNNQAALTNHLRESMSYNERLQVTQYALRQVSDNSVVLGYEYRYDLDTQTLPNVTAPNDGRVRYARDLTTANSTMDRSYSYDQAGRLISGHSGNEARGESNNASGPYNHSYGYDAFGNLIGRHGRNGYAGPGSVGLFYDVTYENDRNQGWTYNAAGEVTVAEQQQYQWNAAGQMSLAVGLNMNLRYDGDGQNSVRVVDDGMGQVTTTYYVRSSVLGGQVVNEINANGASKQRYIYANGQKVGRQRSGTQYWVSEDPAQLTYVETDSNRAINSRVQMDPLGVVTGTGTGGGTPPGGTINPVGYYGNPGSAGTGCRLDGAPFPCDWLGRLVSGGGSDSGSAVWCPNNDCGPRAKRDGQGAVIAGVFEWFRAYADGYAGFIPVKANYVGNGEYRYHSPARKPPVLGGYNGNPRPDPNRPDYGDYGGRLSAIPENVSLLQYDPRDDFRNYAIELSDNQGMSDCLKLALLAYKAGQVWQGHVGNIARGLLGGLTEFSDVGALGSTPPSDPNWRVGVYRSDPFYKKGFGDSGFKPEFSDSSNQVRHFVFYFASTLRVGPYATRYGLSRSENPYNASNPDVALGWAAIDLGNHFHGNYRRLAQDIWHNICGGDGDLDLR